MWRRTQKLPHKIIMTATLSQTDLIVKYANALCVALQEDLKEHGIKWHQRAIISQQDDEVYHIRKIKEIQESDDHENKFYIKVGRRFLKVIHQDYNQRSVHCFINNINEEGWKATSGSKTHPNGITCNLLDESCRETCRARGDWAGSYLYIR